MRRHRKTLTLAGAALTASLAALAGLGAPASAAAATSGLTLGCSNSPSVCNPGAGDVGVGYEWIVSGFADSSVTFTITLASGSLPAGLQFSPQYQGAGDTGGLINGTPTTAGTYNFTLQINDSSGTSATQPYSITVGTGTADNLDITGAALDVYSAANGDYLLGVNGEDPNVGATYTVYNTATGQELETLTDSQGLFDGPDGPGFVSSSPLQNVTVKDSLGSSVTVPVKVFIPGKR